MLKVNSEYASMNAISAATATTLACTLLRYDSISPWGLVVPIVASQVAMVAGVATARLILGRDIKDQPVQVHASIAIWAMLLAALAVFLIPGIWS